MRLRRGPAAERAVAMLAGAGLPLAFAPFDAWWLAPALLALLFAGWLDQPARERAVRGFAFGFGAFAAGTYWLYISIHDVGGAPPVMAVLVMMALFLLMAAYQAAAGAASAVFPVPGAAQFLLVFPAAWTVLEWVRGALFGGFPWLSTGYSQIDGPLAAWAPVGGVHLVSLLTAVAAGGLGCLVVGPARRRLAGVVVLLGLAAATTVPAGRTWAVPEGDALRVALVQGGIPQDRKWLREELEDTMRLFLELSVPLESADLLVWPEAAIPALAHEVQDYLDSLGELSRARGQQLILGILTWDGRRDEYHNSLVALGAEPGVYHKRHLVPFGEYFPVPDFVRDFLRLLDLPYQDITPGRPGQAPLRARGVALAPSICYEDVFGEELRDFLPAAGLLVNVSNDGWFGDSIAPHQHLQMARFRALEAGRPMLRSTNTGVTAVIDSGGRVVARGRQFRPEVVEAEVRPMGGTTPWIRYGHAPALLLSALMLVAAFLLGRSNRGRPTGEGSGR